MRTLQLLTLALLATAAKGDFVIVNASFPLTGAAYSCVNVDGGAANMGLFRGAEFGLSGGAMDGPIGMPCLHDPSSGSVQVSTTLDFTEETDSILRMLETPLVAAMGSDVTADATLNITGPDMPISLGSFGELTFGGSVRWDASLSGCIGFVDTLGGITWPCSASFSDIEAAFPPDELPPGSHYVEYNFSASGHGSGTVSGIVFGSADEGYRIFDMSYGLTAVPEPSSLLLLATAGIALLVSRPRRSARNLRLRLTRRVRQRAVN